MLTLKELMETKDHPVQIGDIVRFENGGQGLIISPEFISEKCIVNGKACVLQHMYSIAMGYLDERVESITRARK